MSPCANRLVPRQQMPTVCPQFAHTLSVGKLWANSGQVWAPNCGQTVGNGNICPHLFAHTLFAHSLPTVCPQFAHTCPQFTHSLPTLCPHFAHSLPTLAHSLPTVYPQFTHSLPTVYPQFAHSLPTVCPHFQ